METTIKFAKVNPTAIIPTKREEDAGFDIYANFEGKPYAIPPHTTVMIPTGIACVCDPDYCFIIKERGSTGTKGMAQRCGVIDSGYRNEIFVPITNTNNGMLYIGNVDEAEKINDEIVEQGLYVNELPVYYPYEKAIAQLLVIPVPKVTVEEIPYEELKAIPSDRGDGKLGSSGK